MMETKRIKLLAIILAMALLLALMPASALAEEATPYEGPTFIISNGTGSQCIEGYGGTNTITTGVIDMWGWWNPVGSTSQHYYLWKLVPDANHEYFQIRRITSSTTYAVGNALAPNVSNRLRLATPSNTVDNQWWKLERQANNRFIITNKANPTLCIAPVGGATANGTEFDLLALTATNNVWQIAEHTPTSSTRPNASTAYPVASAAAQTGIKVAVGTAASALGLPTAVNVTYANTTEGPVYVTWNTTPYNGNVAGVYNLTGTLTMNGLATNPNNVTASIAVTVEGEAEPFDYLRAACYTAAEGNIARLPSVAQITNTLDPNATGTAPRYNPLTGAGVDRPGINANFLNPSYSSPTQPTHGILRVIDGIRPTAGSANGYLSWAWVDHFGANNRLYFILNFGQPYRIDAVRCDWWTDANVTVPNSEAKVEWLDGTTWREVSNMKNPANGASVTDIGTLGMGNWNAVTFDPVLTTQIRLKLHRTGTITNGIGLGEWEVFGTQVGGGDTYFISASPLTSFGTVTGTTYTPPAAQTVTVTNTGTGAVTLTQPTSTNYTIGTLSTTTLAATGATATFTVQPKAGLAVGAYNESIAISGSNGASASVSASFTVNSGVIEFPPVIKEAKLVTSSYIELDWEGDRYINNAGASKESTSASNAGNFEVRLNGSTLTQSSPWYWCIKNMTLHGVIVNQNKTTLRLSTALTSAQMTAIQNGSNTLTVRITNGTSNVTSSAVTGNTPLTGAITAANRGPAGSPANTATVYNVVYKPYYREIRSEKAGILMKGSEYVHDGTMKRAGDMVDVILSAIPYPILTRMQSVSSFCIFGPGEHSYNIPEHRSIFLTDNWNRAEGYGGNTSATSAANVERNHIAQVSYYPTTYRSGYSDESILAHEFGHGVHSGLQAVATAAYPEMQALNSEINAIYAEIKAERAAGTSRWTTYMTDPSGPSEIMSTVTAIWYNAMGYSNSAAVNTRAKVFAYDRKLYDFFSKIYSHDNTVLAPAWIIPPITQQYTQSMARPLPLANPQTRPIGAIAPQAGKTVPLGTAIGELALPEKVQLAYANSFAAGYQIPWELSPYGLDRHPVTWDTTTYNGNVAGTYTIEGTVHPTYLGEFTTTVITNPNNLKASIAVTVEGAIADQPEIEEVRIITSSMIELHWKVHTKWTGSQAAYRYSDGHPDTLIGAGSSLNFSAAQTTHMNNFEIKLNGSVIAQRTGTFSPYYWHADNYLLHQVRMNQHVSTLRLNTALTTAQMTALENGTSAITVQVVGDVTNRAGIAADKTKVYNAIWKPYYPADRTVIAKSGLRIKGSQYVDARTVEKAAAITDIIMSAMPEEIVSRIGSQGDFCIFGPGEHSGNIPEQRNVITYDQFNRAEGYGGTTAATSAANVERCNVAVNNVVLNTAPYYPAGYRSGYQHESILAHEFGHKIHSAINSVYATTHPWRLEFTDAFARVRSRVMWTAYVRDTASGGEYIATMTSVWYNGMSEGNAANCNTRDEFYRYDRKGYELFAKIFSQDQLILSPDWSNCPNTAAPSWTTGDAAPYDNPVTRALSTIAPQAAITVPVGTPISGLALPAKVQVAFTNSFSTTPFSWTVPFGLDYLPVNWDTAAYNGSVAGTYTILGTPHATYIGRYTNEPYTTTVLTNPDNLKASITVTVKDDSTIPKILEARIITSAMIELHWATPTATPAANQYYRYSDGHPDTLIGAGSSLNFSATQNNHNANFEVKLNGSVLAQRTGTFSPYYWHAVNYNLHQVRMFQHVSTLRLNTALTAAQMTALENGTSTITVQVVGDVTNRAGEAADKTKIYTAIWKPYYPADRTIIAKSGLRIKGSQYVDRRTVEKAADITDIIMSAMPQAVVNRISSQGDFCIFGPGEHSGNIPEQRNVITYDQFNRAEGYGGTTAATSAANVERCNVAVNNVVLNTAPYYPAGYRTGYQHESILAHEFGHKIHSAFNTEFATTHPLRQEYLAAFANVTSRGMWTAYVRDASGASEYWSTMTSVWYNGMGEGNAANCNTRDEFYRYDRKGYEFFAKVFSLDQVILSPDWSNCPNTAAPNYTIGDANPYPSPQTRALSTVAPQDGVTVPFGTVAGSLTLPAKVQVAFTDSFSTAPPSWTSPYGLDYYPVEWDTSAYNPYTAGTYIVEGAPHHTYTGRYTGQLYTITTINNPNNLKASVAVEVLPCVHDLKLVTEGIRKFWVCQVFGCGYKEQIANYTVNLIPNATTLKAGDTLLVDVVLSGDINYTQLAAEIAFDADLLDYIGHANLQGWAASVVASGADKVAVRSVPSMNMITGAPSSPDVTIVTLEFKVKGGFTGDSTTTSLSFATAAVSPAGGITGSLGSACEPVNLTLNKPVTLDALEIVDEEEIIE